MNGDWARLMAAMIWMGGPGLGRRNPDSAWRCGETGSYDWHVASIRGEATFSGQVAKNEIECRAPCPCG